MVKPGDRVICVRDTPHGGSGNKVLKIGEMYKVKRFNEFDEEIELCEVDLFWCPNRFVRLNDLLEE